MNNSSDFYWDVGRLPFIWKPLPAPSNYSCLPDELPFALTLDKTNGRLCQVANRSVSDALRKAYLAGSEITGMMDEAGIGRRYAEDFLSFIKKTLGENPILGIRVLEIGCGNGYLLHRLNMMGADVVGIEPGTHGAAGAIRYGINIVRDYFPTSNVSGQFDLVILYCVLEHLENPSQIFDQALPFLAEGGRIALAVPDCTPYIKCGDVSMLFHEHWSYFEQDSLSAFLQNSGVSAQIIETATFGGLLYAFAGKAILGSQPHGGEVYSRHKIKAECYRDLANQMLKKLRGIVEVAEQKGTSLGIYVPSRAVNALSMIGIPRFRIRFFDDNPLLHGTYFPGVDISVESRAALLAEPVDELIIFSHTFGERLKMELAEQLPETNILSWEDLFIC